MLTGMPSTVIARSVPWSRLKPRRKYWLALPSPECWVTISPGTASSNSPARDAGRALNSSPLTRVSLAAVGWRLAVPEAAEADVTPFAAGDVAGVRGAAVADREGRARAPSLRLARGLRDRLRPPPSPRPRHPRRTVRGAAVADREGRARGAG